MYPCRCINDIFSYCDSTEQNKKIEDYLINNPESKVTLAFYTPCELNPSSCGHIINAKKVNIEYKGLGDSFKKLKFFDGNPEELLKRKEPKKKIRQESKQESMF